MAVLHYRCIGVTCVSSVSKITQILKIHISLVIFLLLLEIRCTFFRFGF